MKVLIICSGELEDRTILKDLVSEDDIVICADGGYRHAEKADIIPHYLIGDFDSIEKESLDRAVSKGIKIIRYSSDKDKTDTELALELALSLQPSEILIVAATGSRLDHVIANIHLLVKGVQMKKKITLLDRHNEITIVSDKEHFKASEGDIFSLIPFTEVVTGITTSGLKYFLNDGVMEIGKPYGVSNVATGSEVGVKIKSGLLLVIRSTD